LMRHADLEQLFYRDIVGAYSVLTLVFYSFGTVLVISLRLIPPTPLDSGFPVPGHRPRPLSRALPPSENARLPLVDRYPPLGVGGVSFGRLRPAFSCYIFYRFFFPPSPARKLADAVRVAPPILKESHIPRAPPPPLAERFSFVLLDLRQTPPSPFFSPTYSPLFFPWFFSSVLRSG